MGIKYISLGIVLALCLQGCASATTRREDFSYRPSYLAAKAGEGIGEVVAVPFTLMLGVMEGTARGWDRAYDAVTAPEDSMEKKRREMERVGRSLRGY